MSKLPAFQFYPGDWRKDPGVQALDFHDRGVWFELLCMMHESDERGVLMLNGKPMTDDALARTIGLDKQTLTKTLTTLLDYGVASRREQDGAIVCRRMVRDEETRKKRAEAGRKGGNPVLLKQNPTTEVKPKATPSSSTSTSPSGSSSASQKNTGDDSGFDEFWKAYPTRNGKKGNKGQALAAWRKLDMDTRRRVYVAAQNLAKSGSLPPDAQRFLVPPNRSEGADPRWMEWEHVVPDKPPPKLRIHNQHQAGGNADDEFIREQLNLTGS